MNPSPSRAPWQVWYVALARTATSRVVGFSFLIPLIATTIAVLAGQETLSLGLVLGALAVLESRAGGGTPDPVLTAYGLSLGTTAALAASTGDRWTAVGGALFLASDAAIVVRPHLPRRAQPAAEAFVLLGYAAAQALLVDRLAGA